MYLFKKPEPEPIPPPIPKTRQPTTPAKPNKEPSTLLPSTPPPPVPSSSSVINNVFFYTLIPDDEDDQTNTLEIENLDQEMQNLMKSLRMVTESASYQTFSELELQVVDWTSKLSDPVIKANAVKRLAEIQQLKNDLIDTVPGIDKVMQNLQMLEIMMYLDFNENLENLILFDPFLYDVDIDGLDEFFTSVTETNPEKRRYKIRKILSLLILYSRYYVGYKFKPFALTFSVNETYSKLLKGISDEFKKECKTQNEKKNRSLMIQGIFSDFFKKNGSPSAGHMLYDEVAQTTPNDRIKNLIDKVLNGEMMTEIYKQYIKPSLQTKSPVLLDDSDITTNVGLFFQDDFVDVPFVAIFRQPNTLKKVAVRKSQEDVCKNLGIAYNKLDVSQDEMLFPQVLPEESVYKGGIRNSKKNNKKHNKKPKKTYKKTQKTNKRHTIKASRPLPKKNKTIRNHSKTI